MGGRVSLVDDIQILQEMLKPDTQVVLQSRQGNPSVKLTDTQSGTTVEVKGLPHDSKVSSLLLIGLIFQQQRNFICSYQTPEQKQWHTQTKQ